MAQPSLVESGAQSAEIVQWFRKVRRPDRYPWVFQVTDVELYLDRPVVLDAQLRSRLEAFLGRAPDQSWSWFVQANHIVSGHDFNLLTRAFSSDAEAQAQQN